MLIAKGNHLIISRLYICKLKFTYLDYVKNLDQFWILSFCKAATNKILDKPYKIISRLYMCKLKFTYLKCKMTHYHI